MKSVRIRSTGTVHTPAKARLTRVAILIRIPDPDRHQNLIICSVRWPTANLSWKFHVNPFGSFCAKWLTDRQRDRQTDRQTNKDDDIGLSSLVEVKMSLRMYTHVKTPMLHVYNHILVFTIK